MESFSALFSFVALSASFPILLYAFSDGATRSELGMSRRRGWGPAKGPPSPPTSHLPPPGPGLTGPKPGIPWPEGPSGWAPMEGHRGILEARPLPLLGEYGAQEAAAAWGRVQLGLYSAPTASPSLSCQHYLWALQPQRASELRPNGALPQLAATLSLCSDPNGSWRMWRWQRWPREGVGSKMEQSWGPASPSLP